METTLALRKRLDVDGAESTETLATAQLISAEQLWQHAELTHIRRMGVLGSIGGLVWL